MKILWRDRSNPLVSPIWDRAFEALGKAVATVVCLFDPEAVIIGGGMSRGEGFVDALRESAMRFLSGPYRDVLDLRTSALGNDAALIGAASLTRGTDIPGPTGAPGRGR